MHIMKKYVVLEKKVGETPLQCMEEWRAAAPPAYQETPLAYAGRLDPMASGKLLILIGDECKVQEQYHRLDKAYEFSVLFTTSSDTADVLGIISSHTDVQVTKRQLSQIAQSLVGEVTLPYPHYSSKTVHGKPLHTWAIEGRLNEIEIPTKKSFIHTLSLTKLESLSAEVVFTRAQASIDSLPPVTELRKAIGNDFRRVDVRASWQVWREQHTDKQCQIATFRCIASSGTYMRTLAEVIARRAHTEGLAFSIHRSKIGVYQELPVIGGFFKKQFR